MALKGRDTASKGKMTPGLALRHCSIAESHPRPPGNSTFVAGIHADLRCAFTSVARQCSQGQLCAVGCPEAASLPSCDMRQQRKVPGNMRDRTAGLRGPSHAVRALHETTLLTFWCVCWADHSPLRRLQSSRTRHFATLLKLGFHSHPQIPGPGSALCWQTASPSLVSRLVRAHRPNARHI